jgi:hypothetical protein
MQGEENRLHARFPSRGLVTYTVLGDDFHPPCEDPAKAEIIDVNDYGVKISLKHRTLKVGFLLVLRIGILETRTTIPTLVQVRWLKKAKPGVWHAGLSFML